MEERGRKAKERLGGEREKGERNTWRRERKVKETLGGEREKGERKTWRRERER